LHVVCRYVTFDVCLDWLRGPVGRVQDLLA